MINKKLSLLFVSPFFLATPLLLASCATVSQYGVAASINFKTTNASGTGGSSSSSKEGELMSGTTDPNYDTEFSKYHFDWTNSKLFKDKTEVGKDENKEFGLLLSMGIIPEISLFSHLVTGSHIGFSSSETNNPLFGAYGSNGNNHLKEFMYASSNTLNQGRSGEIRLSISNIDIKADKNFLPKSTDKLKVTDVVEKPDSSNNGKKYKVSNVQFQNESKLTFSFTMKYFYSGDSNPFKTDVKKETVNSYIGSKGQLWNGTTATQDSFTLSSKLQVNINPIYSVNSDYTLDYDVTNGVTDSNNGAGSTGGSSTTTMTKPNNDITYSNFKDHLTLVGASVQYTYMNGTSGSGMENDFAKALNESLNSKEETTNPSTKEENNDVPKVEKRKMDNGSTLTTWLNKANEFSKVTTNQDIQNYRNTLSTGFKNTITLTNTTSASLSKK